MILENPFLLEARQVSRSDQHTNEWLRIGRRSHDPFYVSENLGSLQPFAWHDSCHIWIIPSPEITSCTPQECFRLTRLSNVRLSRRACKPDPDPDTWKVSFT